MALTIEKAATKKKIGPQTQEALGDLAEVEALRPHLSHATGNMAGPGAVYTVRAATAAKLAEAGFVRVVRILATTPAEPVPEAAPAVAETWPLTISPADYLEKYKEGGRGRHFELATRLVEAERLKKLGEEKGAAT